MLDFRIRTFLAVCEHMSFTKAAQALHLTQPAVSQHIHSLQQQLGTQLFTMQGRQVVLTAEGTRYGRFVRSLQRDIRRFTDEFLAQDAKRSITFGATLTIGEFTLPPMLARLMETDPERHITMHVDNTEVLLSMLDEGAIDVAFIEGAFDKHRYGYRLFSHERFIGIGSASCMERHPNPTLEELLGERLIIRESGSGTRGVLERFLVERGLSTEDFCHVDEIGNLNVIKHLVSRDRGISFMYEAAARASIASGTVRELPIEGWQVIREFNYVFPLGSQFESRFLDFYDECMSTAIMT